MILGTSNILVTGASGGIGSKVCSLLAALGGATLVLHGIHAGKVNRFKATLPGQHQVVIADIQEPEGRQAITDACARIGGVDAVVNLAGITDFHLFHEQNPATIERILQVNAVGPLLLTRALLPALMARPRARVINVGATCGSIGHPGFVAYCASKAALKAFSEALARELADTRVSVAYIAPRLTDTEFNGERVMRLQHALGRACDSPLLVAADIVDLLESDDEERLRGWREKWLVKLNALLPSLVKAMLLKQLPLIKRHATR